MSTAPRTLKLGADVFTVRPLGALRNFTLQPLLVPPVVEVIGSLLEGGAIDTKDIGGGVDLSALLAANLDMLTAAVARFFAKLPPKVLEEILVTLLGPDEFGVGGTTVNIGGQAAGDLPLFLTQVPGAARAARPFDTIMQGRTLHTWQLLWCAIEVNYPDFFAAAAAQLAARSAVAPSPASTTSPPPAPAGG